VDGATTVTLLKTVVPVATALPPLESRLLPGELIPNPGTDITERPKSTVAAGREADRGITVGGGS
jgi:hypothetical protein